MADNSSGVKSELPNVDAVAVELEDGDISPISVRPRHHSPKERVFGF